MRSPPPKKNVSVNYIHYHPQATHAGADDQRFLPGGIRGRDLARAGHSIQGAVNYPWASVTSRSHDDLLSRGNIAPGQIHHHLITTNLSEFL